MTYKCSISDSVRDPGVGVGGHAGVLTFHPGGAAVSEAGDAHGHTSLALDLIQEGLHNDSQGKDLVFFITANKNVGKLIYCPLSYHCVHC